MDDPSHTITNWFSNILGGTAVVATVAGLAPPIAAIIAAVWYLVQIYESATVQRWIALRRVRKLARLKARVLMLEVQSKPPLPGPESGGLH